MYAYNGYYYKTIEKSGTIYDVITNFGIGNLQVILEDGFIPVDPITWLPINLVFDDTNCDIREAFKNGEIDFIREM